MERVIGRGRGGRYDCRAVAPPPGHCSRHVLAKPSPLVRLASVHALPRAGSTDAALAIAARDGHPAAAGEIWDRFAALVRGLLRRSLGPDHDVEDHVQEVFLRFFSRLRELREPSAVRSFLVGITLRVSRSELRRRRLRRWLHLTEDGALPDTPAAACDDAAREALARLYRILDGLDDEARLAFVLRHVEGLELTEVAGALEVSLATVKRRLGKVSARVLAQVARDPILSDYLIAPGRELDASDRD